MKLVPGSDSSLLKLGRRRLTTFITSLLLALFIPAVSLFLSGCGLLLEELLAEDNECAELTTLAVYEIRDDWIYPCDFPEVDELYLEWQADRAKHEAIWEVVSTLFPPDFLDLIAYMEIVTDGVDETMGAIEGVDDTDEELYILSLDIIDLYDDHEEIVLQVLVETILHELGHLITLNETQVNPVEYEDANPDTYYTDYGDTREDSYLNLFFRRFWVDIYDQWSELAEIEDDLEREEALENFYEKHKSKFVSDYAVTDPDEDIAETMMMFILNDKPNGRNMAEQKILFLYEFPELMELRDEMRSVLNDYNLTATPGLNSVMVSI